MTQAVIQARPAGTSLWRTVGSVPKLRPKGKQSQTQAALALFHKELTSMAAEQDVELRIVIDGETSSGRIDAGEWVDADGSFGSPTRALGLLIQEVLEGIQYKLPVQVD